METDKINPIYGGEILVKIGDILIGPTQGSMAVVKYIVESGPEVV
jgi:hypothetical protein